MAKRRASPKRRVYKPTYLRAWREHRGLTQEALAARIEGMFDEETTTATISRLENGKQPYGQALLEALAAALNCEPADIIRRPPGIEDEIRLVWSQLSPEKQKQAIDIIKVLREGAA